MKKCFLIVFAITIIFDSFFSTVQARKFKWSDADFTNKNSAIREKAKELDPRNKNSAVSEIGRKIDVTNPNSWIRDEFRNAAVSAWAEAGGAAYPLAEKWMKENNDTKRTQNLDSIQKHYLRPHYGDLVDKIKVLYNANMIDEWSIGGYEIKPTGTDSNGQAFGYNIYINGSYKKGDRNQIVLLAHELMHANQFKQYGETYGKFGWHYFKAHAEANLVYAKNKLEVEAYDFENKFVNWLNQQPIMSFVGELNSQEFFRLKNRWTGQYMHIENKTGYVELTQNLLDGGMESSQWSVEPVADSFFRLKNRWTGQYMHIENKTGYVELTQNLLDGGMESSQWKSLPVADGFFRLKSRWTGDYMHIEEKLGKVQVSSALIPGGMESSQWILEKVQ